MMKYNQLSHLTQSAICLFMISQTDQVMIGLLNFIINEFETLFDQIDWTLSFISLEINLIWQISKEISINLNFKISVEKMIYFQMRFQVPNNEISILCKG